MVKREKSPPPVEDSKFLTIVHPFPLNAIMEIPEDFKNFMYWLASIVGKDYALGVYHKPSARGMVVAEVSKSFQVYEKLLGEHSWSKFLNKLSDEERERKTRVYYSTYSNGRALQKDGWKNILADDELFSDFRPVNRMIKHPYPVPVWCDVPYEDPTNKRICRPLPVETKAPPLRAPVSVPGSGNWVYQKAGGKSSSNPSSVAQKGGQLHKGDSQGASTKGKAKSPVNPDAWKTPITSPTTINKSSSTPATSSTPSVAAAKSAWSKPLAPAITSKDVKSLNSASSDTPIPTPRSVSPASAVAGTEFSFVSSPSSISRARTLPPPGLEPLNVQPPPGKPTNPRGSSSITVLQNQFATTSIEGSASSLVGTPSMGGYDEFDSEEDDDDFVFPNASAVTSSSNPPPGPGNEPRTGKGPGKGKFSQGNVIQPPRNEKEDRSENLWSKVPQKSARTFQKVIEEDELCPLHDRICSKGICSIMRKRKREKERLEKQETRKKEKAERLKAKMFEENGEMEEEEEEGEDDATEEVGTKAEVESVVRGVAVEAAAGTVARSAVGSQTSTVKPPSARVGDWGPKRGRNAKQRGQVNEDKEDDEDTVDSASVSSARPTYGGPAATNSMIFSETEGSVVSVPSIPNSRAAMSAYASISSANFSSSTMKPTPTRSVASASVSASVSMTSTSSVANSSVWATVGSTVTVVKPVKGNLSGAGSGIANNKGKGVASAPASHSNQTSQEKSKGKGKSKTWIEMMEEDDGSELGSVDF